jgi:hypothetical protein
VNKIDITDITQAAIFHPQWLKEPYSWVGHMPFASWLVQCFKPRVYVELGTHTGNSYFSVCQATKEYQTGTRCYAVDTWQGDAHAKNYGEEVFDMVQKQNSENYADFSKLLRMTFDEALAQFDDGSVNLLHIDGLHTYEAVKHDFETWFRKLAPSAIVMFHDTNVFKEDFGVWKYWGELKEQFPNHIEFQHSHGLGVLSPNGVPERLQECAPFQGWADRRLLAFFAALGQKYEQLGSFSALQYANEKHLSQVRELWRERDLLSAKCSALDARILNMKDSLSWKLTAPLRSLGKLIGR